MIERNVIFTVFMNFTYKYTFLKIVVCIVIDFMVRLIFSYRPFRRIHYCFKYNNDFITFYYHMNFVAILAIIILHKSIKWFSRKYYLICQYLSYFFLQFFYFNDHYSSVKSAGVYSGMSSHFFFYACRILIRGY
jgi:hypothetical protein